MAKKSSILPPLIMLSAGLVLILFLVAVVEYQLKVNGDDAAAFIFFIMPWAVFLNLALVAGPLLTVGGAFWLLVFALERAGRSKSRKDEDIAP